MKTLGRAAACVLGVQIACLCVPLSVQAQLDEARARYEEADFDAALAALSRAESGSDLDADGVVELFRLRALVHLGRGDLDAMREDVRALLALRPSVQLDETTPPEVREAAEALRAEVGPLRVETALEPTASGARIDANVTDELGLVRQVRLHTRVAGGSWLTGEPPVALDVPSGAELAYRAEAVGPGGAVVARDGTASDPLRWTGAGPDVRDAGADGGGSWLWVGLLGGAAAVAAGVVLVVLLTSDGSNENTQPTLPMALSYGP